MIRWHPAHAGLSRCSARRWRIGSTFVSASASFNFGTFPGGGGGGEPSKLSRIHLPRSTGDVRVAYEDTVKILPCPRSPPRTRSAGNVTRRKWVPYTPEIP